MAKKRQETQNVVADEPQITQETPIMVEPTTDTTEPTDTTVTTDNGTDQSEPVDPLQNDCPVTELLAWYTDDERAQLRSLFSAGQLTREKRAISISYDKNPTGVEQKQAYWGYVPVFALVSDDDGRIIVDATAAFALAGRKLAFHSDWPKDQKADTPDKEAAKASDEQWGVSSYFNHGYDLKVRAAVRAHLSDELIGPIGEIAKGVKSMFVNNIADSKQDAFDMVVEKRIKRGMPVPEGLTLERLGIKWPGDKK